MKNVDNMQVQVDNVRKDMNMLRTKREMSEFKNTASEVKSVFDGLIRRLDMTEEIISEFEGMSTETFKTKSKRKKTEKNGIEYLRTVGKLQKA